MNTQEPASKTSFFGSVDILTIEHIRRLYETKQYSFSEHFSVRLHQRGITLADIHSCMLHGVIAEKYPEDPRGSSCLIAGISTTCKPLHVVIGVDIASILYITAYYPNDDEWDSTYTKRLKGDD